MSRTLKTSLILSMLVFAQINAKADTALDQEDQSDQSRFEKIERLKVLLKEEEAQIKPVYSGAFLGFDLSGGISHQSPKLRFNGDLNLGYQHYFGANQIFGIRTTLYVGSNPIQQNRKIASVAMDNGNAFKIQGDFFNQRIGINLDFLVNLYQKGKHAFGLNFGAGYQYNYLKQNGRVTIDSFRGQPITNTITTKETTIETTTTTGSTLQGQGTLEAFMGNGGLGIRLKKSDNTIENYTFENKELTTICKKNGDCKENQIIESKDFATKLDQNWTNLKLHKLTTTSTNKTESYAPQPQIDSILNNENFSTSYHAPTANIGFYYYYGNHQFGLNYRYNFASNRKWKKDQTLGGFWKEIKTTIDHSADKVRPPTESTPPSPPAPAPQPAPPSPTQSPAQSPADTAPSQDQLIKNNETTQTIFYQNARIQYNPLEGSHEILFSYTYRF